MSATEALVAATRNAAENIDLLQDIGTLEVRKLADIAVVRDNPADDVSAARQVVLVCKEGSLARDEIGVCNGLHELDRK